MKILENGLLADMDTKQKEKAASLAGLHKRLITTIQILDSDVKFAREHWHKDESSQFWGRTLVRCCCASVEGTLSVLKGSTPDTAQYFGVNLDEEDIEVITELRTDKKSGLKIPAFLELRKNVKKTLKVFAKAHGIQIQIQYDDAGFTDDLCGMFGLRNKLMHPKEQRDLEVSNEALDAADRGLKWFKFTLKDVLGKCGEKLPFPRRRA